MEVLTYPERNPINWANPPRSTTRCSSDEIATDGVRFTGSFRTVCHMAHLMDLSRERFGFEFRIIQPPYHTGVGVSAGTHDKDACSDLYPPPAVSFPDFQAWLRWRGFDCWWRHTGDWASASEWHVHGFTHPKNGIRFATKVGVYVDGGISQFGFLQTSSQIVDYMNHATGLEGQHAPGSDDTPFPSDPNSRAFNLGAYIRKQQEETMEYKDWSDVSKRQLAGDIADIVQNKSEAANTELLHRQVEVRTPDGLSTQNITIRQAIARAANGPVTARLQGDRAVEALKASDSRNAE